jgi:hypothetical protein
MDRQSQKAAMDRAASYLLTNYSPRGQRVGWLQAFVPNMVGWWWCGSSWVFRSAATSPTDTLTSWSTYPSTSVKSWAIAGSSCSLGQRALSIAGFAMVLVALLIASWALYTDHIRVLPFAAALMLWGHYWDAENVMTIPSMVARPEYRGTASGFAYIFVKVPSFLAIFLFPVLFSAIGQANATLFTAIFPLIGLLAAIFVLPEVYGFEHD